MIQILNNLPINIVFDPIEIKVKTPILFLHGFTGSSNDWKFILGKIPTRFSPVFIDLIGHGKSESPNDINNYTKESQMEIINQLLDFLSIKKIIIVGYSMGGRLALSFTMKFPKKIKALVLESTSFGIENHTERKERIFADAELSKLIKENGISDFIDHWMNIPLFETFKKVDSSKIEKLRRNKVSENNIIGLQNSLVGFSPGRMKYLGNSLNLIDVRVLIIAGKLDEKYCKIALDIKRKIQNSELKIANNCGHNVHFEKPEEFLKFLNSFLINIRDKEKN